MTQLFDLNATIVLVVLTTANFGGFSNFCRYYTRSQAGKSTGYRPTLKPLLDGATKCSILKASESEESDDEVADFDSIV